MKRLGDIIKAVGNFFQELEEDFAKAQQELRSCSKKAMPEPCPGCGCEYSRLQIPLTASYATDFIIFPMPAAFTVCDECGMPV